MRRGYLRGVHSVVEHVLLERPRACRRLACGLSPLRPSVATCPSHLCLCIGVFFAFGGRALREKRHFVPALFLLVQLLKHVI